MASDHHEILVPISKSTRFPVKYLLLITLFHFKLYLPDRLSSWLFELPKTTLRSYRNLIILKLYEKYQDFFAFPTFEARKKNEILFENKHVTVIIDGTEQPMVCSSSRETRNRTRSKKKENFTITKLFAVNPKGQLLYMSNSYPGAISDAQMSSFVGERLKLSKYETIMGDKGFPNLKSIYPSSITPTNKPYKSTLTKVQKARNARISAIRIVVENYFAALKANNILRINFRGKGELKNILIYHHSIWVILSSIHKIYIKPHGLRSN